MDKQMFKNPLFVLKALAMLVLFIVAAVILTHVVVAVAGYLWAAIIAPVLEIMFGIAMFALIAFCSLVIFGLLVKAIMPKETTAEQPSAEPAA